MKKLRTLFEVKSFPWAVILIGTSFASIAANQNNELSLLHHQLYVCNVFSPSFK